MIQRRDLLIAAALAPVAGHSFAASSYTAGKEYLVVNPPAPSSRDTIEVIEFFAYTCPHCLKFEPTINAWKKNLPADVTFRVCPVAWQPKFLPFTQTYYALDALDLLDKLHLKFFESVIYQERTYNFENPAADIAEFMADNGVDAKKWEQTMRSFGVQNKARIATQTWQAYQIDSTPMVGVAGLYTTGAHLVGTREQTPAAIDFLINEVRRQRRG